MKWFALSLVFFTRLCFSAQPIIDDCVPRPIVYPGPSQTIKAGDSVRLGGMPVPDQTYRWVPADTLDDPNISAPLATPSQDTLYTLKVETKCGIAQRSVIVRVTP